MWLTLYIHYFGKRCVFFFMWTSCILIKFVLDKEMAGCKNSISVFLELHHTFIFQKRWIKVSHNALIIGEEFRDNIQVRDNIMILQGKFPIFRSSSSILTIYVTTWRSKIFVLSEVHLQQRGQHFYILYFGVIGHCQWLKDPFEKHCRK